VLLGQVLLDVTGRPFPALMRDTVLAPMGMTGSTFEQPLPAALLGRAACGNYGDGVPVPGGHHIYAEIPAGGLWATPADLARFLIQVQRSLRGDAGAVLTREEAALLLTEVMRDYGLGFDLRPGGRAGYFGHRGANDGFRCGMIAHRTSGDGLVLLTNSDRATELYASLVKVIGKREGWPGF